MISASIVIYNENFDVLEKTIKAFIKTPINKKLYLIDNSPKALFKNKFLSNEIEYIFTGKNLGFGKGHNLVLDKLNSNYHLILNPDVEFNKDVIPKLVKQLDLYTNVSFISPKVLYPNNNVQLTCRKHPSFKSLLLRKLTFSRSLNKETDFNDKKIKEAIYPEFIHGCFMLFRTEDFLKLKGFDERFFMYMEDADICRKIEKSGKKIMYFPSVSIVHHHRRSSSKNLKLLFIHISSAIKYFLKWGFR